MKRMIEIEVSDIDYQLLSVLGDPREVLARLADHASQGVYRPGAWEREWLHQAFGDSWEKHLEPGDPFGRADCERIFQKPSAAFLETLKPGFSA